MHNNRTPLPLLFPQSIIKAVQIIKIVQCFLVFFDRGGYLCSLDCSVNQTNNNMNNKLIYETPMAELILVRFEENILSGGQTNDYHGSAGDRQGGIAGETHDLY